MKIDIVTLHYVKNYGSVLQTYATQTVFERLGCTAEFIDYVRPNEQKAIKEASFKQKFSKWVKQIILWIKTRQSINKENIVFKEFVDKYIKLSRYYNEFEDLCKNPPEADVYCTGSDQMWNCKWNGGIIPAYYLEFAPADKKRIAYAASIGMEEIPAEYREQVREMTLKYDAISVRESSAVEVLKTIDYMNAVHVLDPTFMLTEDEWKKIMAPRVVDYSYVLVYQLNPNSDFDEFARKLAKEKNIKVLRVAFSVKEALMSDEIIYFPTVSEWVSLFYHASYVVTDSFHGTAFSINLKKQFFVFYPPRFKTRLDSVLELTGLQDRIAENKDVSQFNDINCFDEVHRILSSERNKAEEFLKQALKD